MITWSDCFNDGQEEWIRHEIQSELLKNGLLMCFLCGSAIVEKRDWLHVNFHNSIKKNKNDD